MLVWKNNQKGNGIVQIVLLWKIDVKADKVEFFVLGISVMDLCSYDVLDLYSCDVEFSFSFSFSPWIGRWSLLALEMNLFCWTHKPISLCCEWFYLLHAWASARTQALPCSREWFLFFFFCPFYSEVQLSKLQCNRDLEFASKDEWHVVLAGLQVIGVKYDLSKGCWISI